MYDQPRPSGELTLDAPQSGDTVTLGTDYTSAAIVTAGSSVNDELTTDALLADAEPKDQPTAPTANHTTSAEGTTATPDHHAVSKQAGALALRDEVGSPITNDKSADVITEEQPIVIAGPEPAADAMDTKQGDSGNHDGHDQPPAPPGESDDGDEPEEDGPNGTEAHTNLSVDEGLTNPELAIGDDEDRELEKAELFEDGSPDDNDLDDTQEAEDGSAHVYDEDKDFEPDRSIPNVPQKLTDAYRRFVLSRDKPSTLLTREQEADLAKQIEAGLFAKRLLEIIDRGVADLAELRRAYLAERYEQLANVKRSKPSEYSDTEVRDLRRAASRDVGRMMRFAYGLRESTETTAERTLRSALSRAVRADLETLVSDGRSARADFVEYNLRLGYEYGMKFAYLAQHGDDPIDVIDRATKGLIRAVEGFDYTKGYKFSTYAIMWMRQRIGLETDIEGQTVRLPKHILDDMRMLDRLERQLSDNLAPGQEVDEEELGQKTGLTAARIAELRYWRQLRVISLNTLPQESASDDIAMVLDDVEMREEVEGVDDELIGDHQDPTVWRALAEVMASARNEGMPVTLRSILSDKQYQTIVLRFGLFGHKPHTLEEIGGREGVTKEAIRQREVKIMKILRANSKLFDQYQ